LLKAHNKDTEA